jgi:hypothetical protein
VNGGVKAGAEVRGSQPFQCSLITATSVPTTRRAGSNCAETQCDNDYSTSRCVPRQISREHLCRAQLLYHIQRQRIR